MTRRKADQRGATEPAVPPIADEDDVITLATGEDLHRYDYFTDLAWEITVDLKRDPTLGDRWRVRQWGPTTVMLENRSTGRELWVRSVTKWRKLRRQL